MRCIWQMDGDKVKGFKCEFSPVDMLIVVSGLKYITADMERHPKDRERAQMIYNKIMLARYTDEQDKTEEFIKSIKALHIIEADRKTEPQRNYPTEWCENCELWREDNCIGVAQCKRNIQILTEAYEAEQTEPQIEAPYIDIESGILHWCGWKYRRIYENEPQTEREGE